MAHVTTDDTPRAPTASTSGKARSSRSRTSDEVAPRAVRAGHEPEGEGGLAAPASSRRATSRRTRPRPRARPRGSGSARGDEWQFACRGKKPTTFPYGDERKERLLQRHRAARRSRRSIPSSATSALLVGEAMNDPRINQLAEHGREDRRVPKCKNGVRRLRHGRQPPRVDRRRAERTARSAAATTRTRT